MDTDADIYTDQVTDNKYSLKHNATTSLFLQAFPVLRIFFYHMYLRNFHSSFKTLGRPHHPYHPVFPGLQEQNHSFFHMGYF